MSEPPRFGVGYFTLPSAGLGFPPGRAVSSFSWWGARFGRVFLFNLFFSQLAGFVRLSHVLRALLAGWGEPIGWRGEVGVFVCECVGLFVCVCVHSCVAPPLGIVCCGRLVDVLDSKFCCPNGVGEEYFEGFILVYLFQAFIS